jgi:hypothetical protein
MEYTIYHVLGIKVGCTEQFIIRTKQNKWKYGKDIIVVILEVTTDLDLADELENKYSIELGYGEIKTQDRYKVRREFGKMHTGKIVSLETKEKMRQNRKSNPRYQGQNEGQRRGKVYVERTTGFIGNYTDIANKFEIQGSNILYFARRDKPISRGPNEGLHFAIYKNSSKSIVNEK